MAHDEDLAARIRALLAGEPEVAEKRMFGSLAFLVGGNLALAASGQGGLMVRVDPAETAALLEAPGAGPMVMRGRELDGWLRIDDDAVDTDGGLRPWVERGVAAARAAPPKG